MELLLFLLWASSSSKSSKERADERDDEQMRQQILATMPAIPTEPKATLPRMAPRQTPLIGRIVFGALWLLLHVLLVSFFL